MCCWTFRRIKLKNWNFSPPFGDNKLGHRRYDISYLFTYLRFEYTDFTLYILLCPHLFWLYRKLIAVKNLRVSFYSRL